MSAFKLTTALAAALLVVPTTVFAADACTSVLIDDFKTVRPFTDPDGEFKRLNAIGGDWGEFGGNFTIDTTAGTLTITPEAGSTNYTAEADINPDTVPTYNWFYTQFNDQRVDPNAACFDARNYSGFSLDITAPAGADFNITITQRLAGNCSQRTYDSEYKLLSHYYTTPGQKQSIILPFSDFSKDLSGADFNFQWVKDLTWVNLNPFGTNITISNVYLLGAGCNLSSGNGTAIVSNSTVSNSNSSSSTGSHQTSQKNGAASSSASMAAGGLAAAAVAAVAAIL